MGAAEDGVCVVGARGRTSARRVCVCCARQSRLRRTRSARHRDKTCKGTLRSTQAFQRSDPSSDHTRCVPRTDQLGGVVALGGTALASPHG